MAKPLNFFKRFDFRETRPSQIDKKQKSFWIVVDSNAWVYKTEQKNR